MNHEDNELLFHVGPGTPMGAFMQEYWLPTAVSTEFPKLDSPPVRIKLLGEELATFRDTDGNVGLVSAYYPQRPRSQPKGGSGCHLRFGIAKPPR